MESTKNLNPFADFMDLQAFCAAFGVTERTAWRWQTRRTGPTRITIGRKIYYRRSSVEEWIKRREKQAAYIEANARGGQQRETVEAR